MMTRSTVGDEQGECMYQNTVLILFMPTHTHTHTHTQHTTHAHTHAHKHTHTQTHTRTQTHTHTNTHTHNTHTCHTLILQYSLLYPIPHPSHATPILCHTPVCHQHGDDGLLPVPRCVWAGPRAAGHDTAAGAGRPPPLPHHQQCESHLPLV